MLPLFSFLRLKQPLFFLNMTNRMPSTTTPPTGAAMAMVVVITLDRLAVFWMAPSLSSCWRLAAEADGVSAASLAEGVLLSVDESSVVGSGVAGLRTAGVDAMEPGSDDSDDDESSVGTAAGGSDAVPVDEIRDEIDSSSGVDAGGVGVWTTGVVGVLTAGADVSATDVDCCWFSAAALLVGAVVSATSEVGVVEVGDGDAEAEDEVGASAPLPSPWPP